MDLAELNPAELGYKAQSKSVSRNEKSNSDRAFKSALEGGNLTSDHKQPRAFGSKNYHRGESRR